MWYKRRPRTSKTLTEPWPPYITQFCKTMLSVTHEVPVSKPVLQHKTSTFPRIFLLPRFTGWQHCILKTNLSNDSCGRCTGAIEQPLRFFIIIFYYRTFCKSTKYRLKIEKQKYPHCSIGPFFLKYRRYRY